MEAQPTSSGYTELGDSWSDLKVAKLRYQSRSGADLRPGLRCGRQRPDGADRHGTMGRGVMVADALTGNPIWQAGPAPTGALYNSTVPG